MKTYKHNNREYRLDEKVSWIVALSEDDFYFYRAQYLKLPEPPACFVFSNDGDTMSERELVLIAEYHKLFQEAESQLHCVNASF